MGNKGRMHVLFITYILFAGILLVMIPEGRSSVREGDSEITLYPTQNGTLEYRTELEGKIYMKNYAGYNWLSMGIEHVVGSPIPYERSSITMFVWNLGEADATLETYIAFYPDPNGSENAQMWFDPVFLTPGESRWIDLISYDADLPLPSLSPGAVRLFMRQVETTYADIRIDLEELCSITIPYTHDQPVAVAPEDTSVYMDEALRFDGSASYHGLDLPLTYSWDFNSGTGIINEFQGMIVHHSFQIPGIYEVTLMVFCGDHQDRDTMEVTVLDDTPPVLSVPEDMETYKNTELELSVVECFDPEGDPVNITWTMGDGAVHHGRSVVHSYSKMGNFRVNVSATDSRLYNNKSFVISVLNRAPSCDIKIEGDMVPGFVIRFSAVNVSDPDGDPITNYTWYFGDGKRGYSRNVSHTYTSSGHIKMILQVSDGWDDYKTSTFLDIPENVHPVAVITGPSIAMVGERITFTGLYSLDYEGQKLSFDWTFDGLHLANESLSISYQTTGSKLIRLQVMDSAGGWDDVSHTLSIYEVEHFYPSEVIADDLLVGFHCIEGPRDETDQMEYIDEGGIHRTGSYTGFRSYRIQMQEGRECSVKVEVLEGGPVDLLLLGPAEYSQFRSGKANLMWKDYGTNIDSYFIEFQVLEDGQLFFVVNNDGRFVDGHEPDGGARYRITIRYTEEETGFGSEYVDEPEDEGDMSFMISCCSVIIVIIVIIMVFYVVSRKAEAARADQKPQTSAKEGNVADQVPRPREVRIDPYKKVYGGKVTRNDLNRQPNWKKLDNKFSLTRLEREIGIKDVEKPQFLKAEQPHWESPRELDEAEVDPMMKMGEEVAIPIDVIKGPEVGVPPSREEEEEELLDMETIRRMLEERRKGAAGGDGARLVLPPPPDER